MYLLKFFKVNLDPFHGNLLLSFFQRQKTLYKVPVPVIFYNFVKLDPDPH